MAFHRSPKVTGIAAIAGLMVAYVRRVLQYHQYSWDSALDFLGWWFLHYVAVVLILGIAYAITQANENLLFDRNAESRQLSLEDSVIYGSVVVIVAAISIFILAHLIPFELADGE